MREKIDRTKAFLEKYDRYLGFAALSFGFTIDSLTLTRIDLFLDNLIIGSYLALSGITILLLNIFPNKFFTTWLPFVLQMSFGGLFSGYVIFYSRSASLIASWPFLLMLAVLLLGNEFFRERYKRTAFQLSIWFIALFSFAIFYIPIYVKEISDQVFILSGLASLIVMWIILRFLSLVTKGLGNSIYITRVTTVFIFIGFNVLYFTNLIPPIPLSLKEFGIYYNIKRDGNDYLVTEEPIAWYKFKEKNQYHHESGGSLFAFSSVFAPTDIQSDIIHEWSFYNELSGAWELKSKIQYQIFGGRDGGYRGYSVKDNLETGLWRIDVKNQRGQILGREKFNIIPGKPSNLITKTQ